MNDKYLNREDSSPLDHPIIIFETYEHISDGLVERIKNTVIKGRRDVVINEVKLDLMIKEYNHELIIIGIHDHKADEINKIARIKKKYPNINIIVMSYRANANQQEKFKKMGVKGFINYGMSNDMREQALMTVRLRGMYFELLDGHQHKGTDKDLKNINDIKLSKEHRIILGGFMKSKQPWEIKEMDGVKMGVSGINKFFGRLIAKYETGTTAEAIKIMEERGIYKEEE